jgi:hypothetical protein
MQEKLFLHIPLCLSVSQLIILVHVCTFIFGNEVIVVVCCLTANVNAGDVAVGSHLLRR